MVVVQSLMIPKNLMSAKIPATVMGNAAAVSADDELVTAIHSDESMSLRCRLTSICPSANL